MKTTSLSSITESLGPKLLAVEWSQPFGCSGARLDNTTGCKRIINSNQITYTIDRQGNFYRKTSLVSMESCTEVQRGRFGQSSDVGIRMNLQGTIGSNFPQVTRKGGFNVSWLVHTYASITTLTKSCSLHFSMTLQTSKGNILVTMSPSVDCIGLEITVIGIVYLGGVTSSFGWYLYSTRKVDNTG